jgi:hypothetical protein
VTDIAPTLLALVARAVIRWPERVNQELATQAALIDAGSESAFPVHVRTLFPALRDTSDQDLRAAFRLFCDMTPAGLTDWWRLALAESGIAPRFDARSPVIQPDCYAAWEDLLDDIDPDAALTLELLCQHPDTRPEDTIARLHDWGTVVAASAPDMDKLLGRGVTDLHIHAGGTRLPHTAWTGIVTGSVARRDAMIRQVALEALGGQEAFGRDEHRRLREAVTLAIEARAMLLGRVQPSLTTPPPRTGLARWTEWSGDLMALERLFLSVSWKMALEEQAAATMHRGVDPRLLLDRYLFGKAMFFEKARQSTVRDGPGLSTFDSSFFRATRRIVRKVGKKPPPQRTAQLRYHPAVLARDEVNAAAFVLESPFVTLAELRVAPFDKETPVDLERRFRTFDSVARRLDAPSAGERHPAPHLVGRLRPETVRFAIHFKRSLKAARGAGAGGTAASEIRSKLRELDYSTAVMRAALVRFPDGALARWVKRIDVAGQERTMPAHLFAGPLRLLRGDPPALAAFETWLSSWSDAPAREQEPAWNMLDRWRYLAGRSWLRHLPGSQKLGLTVHSGEDFADVLSGIHQVHDTISLFDMQPGDGVGHGLALVTDPAGFDRRRVSRIFAPIGIQVDSAVWLHDLIRSAGKDASFPGAAEALMEHALDMAREIYADPTLSPFDLGGLLRLRTSRIFPHKDDRARGADLFRLDLCPEVGAKRAQLRPVHSHRRKVAVLEAVRWAQEHVLKAAAQRGVVVETNPSSNIRISGIRAVEFLPSIDLILKESDLRVSINSDNPGVFTTRIENEYALLFDGLLKRDISRSRALEVLERARRTGIDFA